MVSHAQWPWINPINYSAKQLFDLINKRRMRPLMMPKTATLAQRKARSFRRKLHWRPRYSSRRRFYSRRYKTRYPYLRRRRY
jgi:hypothetical protein